MLWDVQSVETGLRDMTSYEMFCLRLRLVLLWAQFRKKLIFCQAQLLAQEMS